MSPGPRDEVLVTAPELRSRLAAGESVVLLDVRWSLGRTDGREQHAAGHVPGAVYVDLDTELAAPPSPGEGRHPLPALADLRAAARRWGVRAGVPVVAYDAVGGTSAARAWWLLRWAGVPDVRLLDGGLDAWVRAGGALETGPVDPAPGDGGPADVVLGDAAAGGTALGDAASDVSALGEVALGDVALGDSASGPALGEVALGDVALGDAGGALPTVDADAVAALAADRHAVVLDARAAERYRGEVEPVDPRAGHVPGAVSAPTLGNLAADGTFLPDDALRARFAALGVTGDATTVVYCGSGVTAAHEVAALASIGVRAALYPGSWSQWSADPERPAAVGPDPG